MVENVDTDGSGSIEFLEFLLLMGKILNDSPNQEDLRNIFTG
jgi:Ca2+-binding EF-hand superfamily protein